MSRPNENANRAQVFARKTYPPATYTSVVQVAGRVDADIRWASYDAAGVATFTIYSAITSAPKTLDAADPTDPQWSDETPDGAVFSAEPTGIIGNGKARLGPNPGLFALLVEMVVSVELTDFEMVMRSQGRAG